MYAKVVIEIGVKNVDKMFTYSVPSNLQDKIKIGIRVKVSFGKQILEGFVLELFENYLDDYICKPIIDLIDEEPILTSEMIELGKSMQNTLLCSLSKAYQTMLPKALKASHKTNIKVKMDKYIVLNKNENIIEKYIEETKYIKQKELLKKLRMEKEIVISKKDSTINTLLKKDLIKIIEKEKFRYNIVNNKVYKKVVLNVGKKI